MSIFALLFRLEGRNQGGPEQPVEGGSMNTVTRIATFVPALALAAGLAIAATAPAANDKIADLGSMTVTAEREPMVIADLGHITVTARRPSAVLVAVR
jgi:hypothetical protein